MSIACGYMHSLHLLLQRAHSHTIPLHSMQNQLLKQSASAYFPLMSYMLSIDQMTFRHCCSRSNWVAALAVGPSPLWAHSGMLAPDCCHVCFTISLPQIFANVCQTCMHSPVLLVRKFLPNIEYWAFILATSPTDVAIVCQVMLRLAELVIDDADTSWRVGIHPPADEVTLR